MRKRENYQNPWEREPRFCTYTADDHDYFKNYGLKRPKFDTISDNSYLDNHTKRSALKASASVVSIISYSGEDQIYEGSGTIIESYNESATILTAAILIKSPTGESAIADNIKVIVHSSDGKSCEGQILACDFHYNLAAIKIQSEFPRQAATLRCLDDSLSIDVNELSPHPGKTFQLRPHSDLFKLVPGDKVISLGRYFVKPYDLMVATGEISLDRCGDYHDCKELFRSNGRITRCGNGGPLINHYGEVIGVNIYHTCFTPFIPINVASKWWEHYKSHRKLHRPCLGMELVNLYAADVHILERIIQKFPTISKGVIVEEVTSGSSAEVAGICANDVIIQCAGKAVQSFLELFEIMWDKSESPVELVVIRPSNDTPLSVTVSIVETPSDKFYSWPTWKN